MRFQEFSIVCGFHLHSIWIWHSPIFIFFPSSYLLLLLLFACILLSFYVVVTATTATATSTTTTIIDNNNSNNNTRMPRAYLCCHVACEVQLAAIPSPILLPAPSSLSLLYSLANHTEINELQLEPSSQRPSVALDRSTSTSTSRADAAAAAAALPVKLQNTFAATAQKPNSPEPGRARGASGVRGASEARGASGARKALPD